VILLIAVSLSPVAGQAPGPVDLDFEQSPSRPAPDGLKVIDQGKFDPRLKGYVTPEGFKVEIVAEEPTVINPVGMTFGPDGALYVLEWVAPQDPAADPQASYVTFTYKDGSKRKTAVVRKPVKDRVKLLSDAAGKGVHDQARVILQDEQPSGILVHDDWLYLAGQGTVRRYPLAQVLKDSQQGKVEFVPQVVAQGFSGYRHHQVSGLTIGNDGWLYVSSGDDDNFVEGADGSRATVLRTGAIFRMRPDGARVHTFAQGFYNPYGGVAFDTACNLLHTDQDLEDGSKFTGCRLMHVPEGADFGWRLRAGARCCQPDPVRAAVQGERPGKLAPILKTGRGAPAGVLIYHDTYLPEPYRGWLFHPDPARRLVRAYKVAPKGATFEVTQEFVLMRTADPLFRPCQMVLGPDGAIYVCDRRTESGDPGRLWGDGKHGRIYRITWAGTDAHPAIAPRGMDGWARILRQADTDLLKTLEAENLSDRQVAQKELARRGEKIRPALLEVLDDGMKPLPARLAALGALQSLWNADVKAAFVTHLKDGSADLRRLCADGLALNIARGDRDVHESLVQVLNEEDPAVLRALYLAVGKVAGPGAADVVVNALRFDGGQDVHLRDGMARALEYLGKEGFQRLLSLADSGEGKDLDRVAEVYPAFRSREAAAALGTLLKNYHLSPSQRAALILAYNNFQLDPPVSLQPLTDYLAQLDVNPPKGSTPDQLVPVKLAALGVLSGNGAMSAEKARAMVEGLLKEKGTDARIAVIKAIGDNHVAPALPLLLEALGRTDSKAEKVALVQSLGALGETSAWDALAGVLKAKGAEPSLRLEALRALAAVDMGKARKDAEALLADPDLPVQREAVVLLGRDPDGARLVGNLFVQKKLPGSLRAVVAESLRRFAADDAECARLLKDVLKAAE
jgi:putative membrane-bound dehydrogenase-like protein